MSNQQPISTFLGVAAAVVLASICGTTGTLHAGVPSFQGLGDLAGGTIFSNAQGVSDDDSASGFEAYRWTSGGGMLGLGDLPGGSFGSFAQGTSADGSVVVGHSPSLLDEAFRWTSGGARGFLRSAPGSAS